MKEYIEKSAAIHAVLHNEGQAAVAAVQEIKGIEIVTCGECKYKPYWCVGADPNDRTGFDIEFPQYKEPNRCPCQCEDGWYAWIPDDDWFCGHGKRKGADR